jgi:hemerythrin superfamily protein
MNAIDLIEKQHRKIEQLLKRLQNAKSGQEQILIELATTLTGHARMEEEIFYPAAQRLLKEKNGVVLKAYEEHAVVTLELDRLLKGKISDAMFKARVKVINDLVMHHIEEEDESILLQVKKLSNKRALDRLGDKMEVLFRDTVEEGYRRALMTERRQSAVRVMDRNHQPRRT